MKVLLGLSITCLILTFAAGALAVFNVITADIAAGIVLLSFMTSFFLVSLLKTAMGKD